MVLAGEGKEGKFTLRMCVYFGKDGSVPPSWRTRSSSSDQVPTSCLFCFSGELVTNTVMNIMHMYLFISLGWYLGVELLNKMVNTRVTF